MFVLVAVLTLLGAEGAVRVGAHRLRDPAVWENPEANAKWHQMDALGKAGGAEAVFVGSSLVGVGIDPARYTEELQLTRTAYNAALLSSSIAEQSLWVRIFVVPMLRPATVVIGVSPRELNANDVGLDAADRLFPELPPVREALDRESLLQRADRKLRSISYLFRYREVLRQPMTMFDHGPVSPEAAMTSLGMSTVLLDEEFTPFSAERLAQQGRVQFFELDENRLTELGDLLSWIKGHGMAAVVVNMPPTEDGVLLLPHGAADQEAYALRLESEVISRGAQYIATDTWPTEQFADQWHLNRRGAQRLTDLLVEQASQSRN